MQDGVVVVLNLSVSIRSIGICGIVVSGVPDVMVSTNTALVVVNTTRTEK